MFFLYFLLFIAFYAIARHLIHKIRNLPPSPFPTLPVLGHLHLLKKPLHCTLAAISLRHGPILLLQFGSRRVLVIASPSAAEECLSKNDIIFANRPHLLAGKYIGYNYTSLAWSSYGEHWRNLRRIASLELLSSHRLNNLSEMKTALFELMMNVMMRMIAGKRYYGENVAEAELEEAKKFREIVTETFRIGGATNVGEFLPVLRKIGFKGVEKELQALQAKRDSFMHSLVEQHKREAKGGEDPNPEGEKNKTLIEVLLSLQESEPEYYKD
ncbi:hypothetical protein CRG98_000248, partial [Punica granatum]